jgi:N6-L-threonylcarbamoyladenine synthase
VAPGHRRQGIARELLQHLAQDAIDLAAATMSLEVRESNLDAQGFYAACGFAQTGRRSRYYRALLPGAVREDAIIMAAALPLQARQAHAGQREMPEQRQARPSPLILAIETSCDETAAAVMDGAGQLLANVVASQVDFHARFGGVVPEIASRKHTEAIVGVVDQAMDDARLCWQDLDAVAVTYAPGLIGALVVGVAFAKGLAWAVGKPLVRVNHLEGHIYANMLEGEAIEPPFVIALLSGGHTMLVHVRAWGDYRVLGQTLDDAVGEAFDKVAKALGLGYPGGPVISRLAEQGDAAAIDFPRALLHSHDYRFSLSGLKTAVITYIRQQQQAGVELNLPDIAASFQQAVIDVQVKKAMDAVSETGVGAFALGGGVAANQALRLAYADAMKKQGVKLFFPPPIGCTDNAAMIAAVAEDRYRDGRFAGLDDDAQAHSDLEAEY